MRSDCSSYRLVISLSIRTLQDSTHSRIVVTVFAEVSQEKKTSTFCWDFSSCENAKMTSVCSEPRADNAGTPTEIDGASEAKVPLPPPSPPRAVTTEPAPIQPIPEGGRGFPQTFNQNMFDPLSIQVLQQCTTVHKSHGRLSRAINENAESMYREGIQHYQAHQDNLTYEQILSTVLFEDERVLLNNQYIYYTSVIFLDENSQCLTNKPPMTHGRAFLTTRRLLLLSAENGIVSSLTGPSLLKTKPDTYHLSIKLGDSMYLQSLPVEGCRSIDLQCAIGVQSDSNVRGEKPPIAKFLEGICCCFKPFCSFCELDFCMKQWHGEDPVTQSYNDRYVTIGTLMPPWGKRMMVQIRFDPSMSLSFINGFLVEMQRHAPNINKLDLASK
ncbi:uncharacterized protein LOC144437822 [Glandiceps talaboti]